MDQKTARAIVFVARCSGAATVAYELALSLGLAEAMWAAMSAVIVSQERLHETRSFLKGRILGTLLGIAIAVSVSEATSFWAASTSEQMALAVAVAALVAHRFPQLRVAMWTCLIILLTARPSVPVAVVALHRGGEVILGAVVGWAFHWGTEMVLDACSVSDYRAAMRSTAANLRRWLCMHEDEPAPGCPAQPASSPSQAPRVLESR
jgi:uncharacterized membrane protein YccC